jgi:hypothetical protein
LALESNLLFSPLAQAGIQARYCNADGMDCRLRGNDREESEGMPHNVMPAQAGIQAGYGKWRRHGFPLARE